MTVTVGQFLKYTWVDVFNLGGTSPYKNILSHYDGFTYSLDELEEPWFEGIKTMKELEFVEDGYLKLIEKTDESKI